MLLEDVGRMSVQYVGHFLLPFELFWMLIKETDRHCPLASVQWALGFAKRHVDFSASVSFPLHPTLIHKVLSGQMHIKLWRSQIKSQLGCFFCTFSWNVWSDLLLFKDICVRGAFGWWKLCVCVLWCPVPRSIEYPSWDWRESRDFDELNHILQESKKLGKALESLSRSEWLPTTHAPCTVFNAS